MFGLDLHPAAVHFPIALGVVGAVAETAYLLIRRPSLKWYGPVLLTLALAGSGAAYFSGTSVKDKAEDQGVPDEAIDKHEESCLWALGALGLATLLSWAVRPKGRAIWLSSLVALAAAGLTLYTGYLGGELVYRHGAGRVGVQAAKPPPQHEEEEH
jgi:uncharacterized membrane protein